MSDSLWNEEEEKISSVNGSLYSVNDMRLSAFLLYLYGIQQLKNSGNFSVTVYTYCILYIELTFVFYKIYVYLLFI